MSRIAKAKMNLVKTATDKLDSWMNMVTGFGTPRDRVTHAAFSAADELTVAQLENLYDGDDMAARICDVVPEEALRMPFQIKIEASDDDGDERGKQGDADPNEPAPSKINIEDAMAYSSDLTKQAQELGLTADATDAWAFARALGGAALFVGAQDGASNETLSEPLTEDNISSIDFIRVVDRQHLFPATVYDDLNDEKHGQTRTYWLTPHVSSRETAGQEGSGSLEIHESRFIIFDGLRSSTRKRLTNDGWGKSVLHRTNDVLRQFQISWQAAANVLQAGAQGVMKIHGLADMIGGDNEGLLKKRMEFVSLNRSAARDLILDADTEEYTQLDPSLSGYDVLLDKFSLRLASAARMPVTVLMGQSPAGMNATGESDIRWFYDTIAAAQTHYLRPKLERAVELMMLADDRGVPDNWSIEFPPLWQETPEQEAATRKLIAETDAIYIDKAVVLEEEVAMSRFPATGYASDTTIDLEMRKKVVEIEIDRAVEEAENPPPPPPVLGAQVTEEDGNTGHLEEDDDSP